MMKSIVLHPIVRVVVLLLIVATPKPAFSTTSAGDAVSGAQKAITCAACHGEAGVSSNDLWPNLAGQKPGYLIKAITEYKDGTRKDPLMGTIAKTLSAEDIKDLAAHFAGLAPKK